MAAAVAAAEAQAQSSGAIASGPAPQQNPQTQQAQVNAAMTAAFRAIARVLAVRFQLLLSLIGDFVLAILAMQWQTPAGLYVLIAFCALTTAPLVWLEFSGRPRG